MRMQQLKRVLDRLPPGPAHRGEIVVYLKTLIDWLSSRPVAAGPAVRRACAHPGRHRAQAASHRHGPGSASRTSTPTGWHSSAGGWSSWAGRARARPGWPSARPGAAPRMPCRPWRRAGALDEVELPLYTTCSRLFSADGDIREAAVSSALDQLGDLGGSRISAALRVFFTERNAPTLLVIDSLDEAHGSDERLRQADTLPWRIVLTSRPSSWKNQLAIKDDRRLPSSRRAPAAALPRRRRALHPALVRRAAGAGRRSCRADRAASWPSAGRYRAVDPGLLLHRRRQRTAARIPARPVHQGAQPHAHRPLAR